MKFIHLSDLHIGKRVNEFSMLDDQKYILEQILNISETADAVVIAGDVYDKSVPSADAVEVFDGFLTELSKRHIPVLIISGNHDSPERLGFGSGILSKQGVYIAGVFDGGLKKVSIDNADFYLLPFLKPVNVKRFYPESEIETYEDAVRTVLADAALDTNRKNILVAHQFVTESGRETVRCDSEIISVGGVDNVDFSVFDGFDYVALGHIHGAQYIGRSEVRYAGSLLKYSFSESKHVKTVSVVTVGDEISIEEIPLKPLRDMREIKGDINTLLSPEIYGEGNTDDYMHITLTDSEEILDAIGKVRAVYPNVMTLDFENRRTAELMSDDVCKDTEKMPSELFAEFFELQNNEPINEQEAKIILDILEDIGGGEN